MAKLNPIELQKALKGVRYPASKEDLVTAARHNEACGDIMAALRDLRDDRFATPAGVTHAVSFIPKRGS